MYTVPQGATLRLAISGKSGCGNTTVSSLLAETLGITLINYTFRQLAAERGVSLADVIECAKTDDSYDRTVDTRQVELALRGSCVLGSRLAIWMLAAADLKVYLQADATTRAERIYTREGGSIEQIAAFTAMRDEEDTKRYQRLYHIDNNDFSVADCIVDTGKYTPEQIVAHILAELHRRHLVERRD
ncbi:MAG: cytidylate kinase family protein [Treponema sp.]|nr:cytidylate kinase family protein [Treponema sp.]